MKEIKSLTKEENYLYFKYLNNGELEYRDKIIIGNYKLVIKEASKFVCQGYEFEDLKSIGVIGLIKAVDSYKLDKNLSFSTYAIKCIRNEILMKFRNKENNINRNSVSIYEECQESSNSNKVLIEDLLKSNDDTEQEVIDKIMFIENINKVYDILETLNPTKKEMILDYFGLNRKKLTQNEIARKYNISRPYVSRILATTLKKISCELKNKNSILTKSKKNTKI